MAWTESHLSSGGGGGDTPLEFTRTKIVDNSTLGNTLLFSEDYHNYNLLVFEIYHSSTNTTYELVTTPDIIDEIFDKSVSGSNRCILFNLQGTNIYVQYLYTSNTQWTLYNNGGIICTAVYGVTCNKTIVATTIYQRGNTSYSAVEITSVDDLFDYDLILGSVCIGNWDCTSPAFEYINLMNLSDLSSQVVYSWEVFNSRTSSKLLTPHKMSSGYYFMVQGINFV